MAALDGARGIAALSVLLLHAWLYTTTQSSDLSAPSDAIAHELRLGLVLFFVLSGFLLWRPWLAPERAGTSFRRRVRRYALRRAARILPAYYVALVGAIVIVLAVGDAHHTPPATHLPLFLVFGQNLTAATLGKLDPPMWTLGVEVCFYVAVPLLGLALRAVRGRAARALLGPALLFIAGTAYNVALSRGHVPPPTAINQLPAMAPDFACGMLAAALLDGPPLRARTRWPLLLGGVLLVVANGAWHTQFAVDAQQIVRDLPAAAGFACVLVALARAPRPGLLATPPLRALGEVSYGLYLWHMPLIFLLRDIGLWPSSMLPAAVLLVALTLVVASASWRLIERPVLRALAPAPPPSPSPSPTAPAPARSQRPGALAPAHSG